MTPQDRLATALAEKDPATAVFRLAVKFKSEGMLQEQMEAHFTELLKQHREDEDETLYEALAVTLDRIVGFCISAARLFPNENSGK